MGVGDYQLLMLSPNLLNPKFPVWCVWGEGVDDFQLLGKNCHRQGVHLDYFMARVYVYAGP